MKRIGGVWEARNLTAPDSPVVTQPNGQIYNTISNGYNTMMGYAAQVPVADRWKIVLYVRATRSKNSAGRWVFWGGVFILTLFWYNNIAGPPPPRPEDAPMASLLFFSLTVAWGYWMNRARVMKEGGP